MLFCCCCCNLCHLLALPLSLQTANTKKIHALNIYYNSMKEKWGKFTIKKHLKSSKNVVEVTKRGPGWVCWGVSRTKRRVKVPTGGGGGGRRGLQQTRLGVPAALWNAGAHVPPHPGAWTRIPLMQQVTSQTPIADLGADHKK